MAFNHQILTPPLSLLAQACKFEYHWNLLFLFSLSFDFCLIFLKDHRNLSNPDRFVLPQAFQLRS